MFPTMPDILIAGMDEVGRGALAGPVVAGICIVNCELYRRRFSLPRWSPFRRKPAIDCLIADSKQLSPEEREISYRWIVEHCSYGIGIADAEYIEEHGIVPATHLAMKLALQDLQRSCSPVLLLVDGRDPFKFSCPHHSIIRGDVTEPCIAAASIVAKVTRDRLMTGECARFPHYRFDKHKGYGTDEHIRSIRTHGICPLHRRSFLTNILTKAGKAER